MQYHSAKLYYAVFGGLVTCALLSCGKGLNLPKHKDTGRSDAGFILQLGSSALGAAASGDDITYATVSDADKSVYVVGTTTGALGETNAGATDVFVAKFSVTGTRLWIKQLGNITVGAAAAGTETARGIALAPDGGVIIAGTTTGALAEANAGNADVFIAKLSSSGSLMWIRQLGNVTSGASAAGNEVVWAVKTNAAGNIFVAGETTGSLGEPNAGFQDGFVAIFNSSGAVQAVRQFGNTTIGVGANSIEQIMTMAIDSESNIYVAGHTAGAFAEANAGSNDILVMKLNSTGVIQWSRQYGNVTIGAGASGTDGTYAIALDSAGNIYIGGVAGTSLGEANGGSNDAYISKLNNSGVVQWTRQLGNVTLGARASGSEFILGLQVDSANNIYATGQTNGNLGETNGGNIDIFAVKFNSSGVIQWLKQFGALTAPSASAGQDVLSPNNLTIDSDGYMYFAGYTSGSFADVNAGTNDVLLFKLKPDGSL